VEVSVHLLVATDLSKGSVPAAQFAFEFADHADGPDGDITVCHVVQAQYAGLFDGGPDLDDPATHEEITNKVRGWLQRNVDRNGRDFHIALREGRAAEALNELAVDEGADWLAVGRSGRGALARAVVGSTSEALGHNPPCNLAVCHPAGLDWTGSPRFAVGIDFTDTSGRALREAAQFVRQVGGTLDILHIVAPPTYETYPFESLVVEEPQVENMDDLVAHLSDELDRFVDKHRESLEDIDWRTETLTGYPTRELTDFADEHALDGIFLGAAGRSAVADFLLGSVVRGVLKHMNTTVFLTPPA
jgi:nucleotide-binding universal stress UspA family protein